MVRGDLMEGKQEGERLVESRAFLEVLYQASPDMIFIHGPDGRIVDVNDNVLTTFGYTRGEFLALGPADTSGPGQSPEQAFELLARARQGEEVDFEWLARKKSGEHFPVEVRLRRIGDTGNVLAQVRDISGRKRSNQYFQRASDIVKMVAMGDAPSDIYDAIALLYESRHPGMRCSMLMLAGNRLLHCGAPSLPEAYCSAVHGLEVGPSVGSCGTSTYTGERVLVEDIATDPKWAELKDVALPHGLRSCWSEPIRSSTGKVLGAFGMYFDHPALPDAEELADLEAAARLAGIVMEREQREVLLRKLHSSVEYAQDAIIISDLDSRMEYVNPAFETMTGYSSAEAVGRFTKILRSGKHPRSFYIEMLETIRQGHVWRGEMTIKCKDGSFREVERNIAPVFDEDGNILFQVNIQRDITEHKSLKEQLLQAQKMEAIGTLVGGIAHDFNNTLAAIQGNLFLARSEIHDKDILSGRLKNIEKLSAHSASMVKQLLTFARKDRVSMQSFSFTSFIKEEFRVFKSIIPENIDFSIRLSDENMLVKGDISQLQQVLINLLSNARDAVRDTGKPKIVCSVSCYEIHDDFRQNHPDFSGGNAVHLCVEDNGCGIRDDALPQLFVPFFTTKGVGEGTGLGLAMVYGSIQTHGGVIEVESRPGEGSAFHIYLPLSEQMEPFTAQETNKAWQGNGETILVADDEADICEITSQVLSSLGYRVLTASDGEEAVEIFRRNSGDIRLVLSDVVMPKMNGTEAVKHIRRIRGDVPVILATGYDKNQLSGEALSGSITVSKPFSFELLSQSIRKMIRQE